MRPRPFQSDWNISLLIADAVLGPVYPLPHFLVPLADTRRAALIEEHGGKLGVDIAADADAEDRARLRGAWANMRARRVG